MTGRVIALPREPRSLGAGTGELNRPASLRRYPAPMVYIDVVECPGRPSSGSVRPEQSSRAVSSAVDGGGDYVVEEPLVAEKPDAEGRRRVTA